MKAKLTVNGVIHAKCDGCGGAVTNFSPVKVGLGPTPAAFLHSNGSAYVEYTLMTCVICGNRAFAMKNMGPRGAVLIAFYPPEVNRLALPESVPKGLVNEFREAELCAAIGAWRAASAMLRSVLEKTLRENGFDKGNLQQKIDEATSGAIITASRQKRAHEEIRVLGNDVLHEEWREEYDNAHRYSQRVLEDFYDARPQVEAVLKKAGKLAP
jgi:Domain of unknown function (DUF4145)